MLTYNDRSVTNFTVSDASFVDIDECSGGTDNCDPNASCENTDGSFTCTCEAGYSGDGVNCESKYSLDILVRLDCLNIEESNTISFFDELVWCQHLLTL